jgi:hypothetical protein
LVQVSVALQHGTLAEQLWLVVPHTGTDAALQVPLVAPAGIAHDVPAQQSPFAVQVLSNPWQEEGVPEPSVQSAQVPLVQVPLQQSAAPAQVPPVSLHVVDDSVRRHA